MKRVYYLIMLLMGICFLGIQLTGTRLTLIKSFGSGSDDFLFQRLHGMAMSKTKDIYVVDGKGNFLARYDWNGKLIKKIGQRGQGPSDFNFPADLNQIENKLIFIDNFNLRVVETDLELEKLTYYKLYSGEPFTGDFFALGNNLCIGKCISPSLDLSKKYKAIKILNYVTQKEIIFFDEIPIKHVKADKLAKKGALFLSASPCIGIDREKKQLLVSFKYPNNPIEFFLYDYDGGCIDQFSYELDPGYKYPKHMITGGRPPKSHRNIMVYSIFAYRGNYLVFVGKNSYTNYWDVKGENLCLIFDANSKRIIETIPVPENLYLHFLSDEGYFLGYKEFQDEVKVFVYKLEL